MRKYTAFMIMSLIVCAFLITAMVAEAEYPTKSISVVVHSSAGGGSDTWARKVSALMEKEIGVKMVVSNKAGGKGGIAANFVWNSAHDGYTLIGASESSMTYGVNGAFNQSVKDAWTYFISGGSPGVIAVLNESPFKTFDDLIAAAKAKPESVKVSNAGIGKLWHLKSEMFRKYGDVPIKHSPYNGSAPAIVALLSKEVDAVSCSAGEVASYIESGKMRPLVMTENQPYEFPGYGNVPAITEALPQLENYLPMSQFLCLIAPKDIPEEAKAALGKAFEAAMASEEMAEFIAMQQAVKYNVWGEAGEKMATEMEKKFSWFAHDLGIAKVNPEELGIEKP